MIIQEKIVCMGLSVLRSIATYDSLGTHNNTSAQNLEYGSHLRAGGRGPKPNGDVPFRLQAL